MQVSESLLIVEPDAFRHKAFHELQHSVGSVYEATKDLARIGIDGAIAALIKHPLCSRRPFGRRQIEKCQEITRLVVGAGLLELCSPLGIDQGGRRVRKGVGRIVTCGMALRFYKNCPTGFETAQCVVQATGNGDELGWYGAIEVRPRNFAVR